MKKIILGNKTFYTLIAILMLAVLAVFVYATNSGNPAIHGHTSDEIQGIQGGLTDCQLVTNSHCYTESVYPTDYAPCPAGYTDKGHFDPLASTGADWCRLNVRLCCK